MQPIRTDVVISDDHKLRIELDLPEEIPAGEAEVVVTVLPKNGQTGGRKPNRFEKIFGAGRDGTWMADDFDEPLEDFAEYM